MRNEQQIAAIYCRLSKEDLDKSSKGDDSESIQNQKLLLMDYSVNNGFLIHNVYVDEDLSGFSDRPAFKQMIKDAAESKFNIILCKSQSRFTRDMELVERYIHGCFAEWGIRFIGVTDNVDTNVKGNKKARQIYGLINEWYSEDLSENIRTVFKKKMEAGQFLGSFAAYGYVKDPADRHRLAVDPVAAKVVREIFALCLAGNGMNKIAATLTDRGELTPTRYKKKNGLNFENPKSGFYSENFGCWSATTINRMLQNEIYIGVLIQGRERKISYKSKKVVIAPKDDWIVIPGNHEAIVDEDTFFKVQKILARRRRTEGGAHKNKPHVLAGKIICGTCGATLQRSGPSRDGKTHYLRCRLSAKSKRRDCTPHCTTQAKVEAAIAKELRNIIVQVLDDGCEDVAKKVALRIKKEENTKKGIEKQLADITSKINMLQKNIAMTYSDKLNGNITEEDFSTFKQVFEDERKTHVKRKEILETELAFHSTRPDTHNSIALLVRKYRDFSELTHEMVGDFVESVVVSERDPETGEQPITINWLF